MRKYFTGQYLMCDIRLEILHRGKTPKPCLARQNNGLILFVKQNGNRLAQFFLNAIRPGQVKYGFLLARFRVGKVISHDATRQPLRFHPVIQGFQTCLLSLAGDAADHRHCRCHGSRWPAQSTHIAMQQLRHPHIGFFCEKCLAGL